MLGPGLAKKLNQDADDDHADGRPDGSEDEQGLPAEAVDEEEADDSAGQLGDIDDAGLDELLLVGEAEGGDHGGRVVDEGVDADHLLEEAHEYRDQGPAPAARAPGVYPGPEVQLDLGLEGARLQRGVALDLDLAGDPVLGPHAKPFGLDKDVVGAALAELGEHGQGLLVAALHCEPPRAWGHREGTNKEDDAGNHLQSEGDTERRGSSQVPRSEAHPVRDHDSQDDEQLV